MLEKDAKMTNNALSPLLTVVMIIPTVAKVASVDTSRMVTIVAVMTNHNAITTMLIVAEPDNAPNTLAREVLVTLMMLLKMGVERPLIPLVFPTALRGMLEAAKSSTLERQERFVQESTIARKDCGVERETLPLVVSVLRS